MHEHLFPRKIEDLCILDGYPQLHDPSLQKSESIYLRLMMYGNSKEEIYRQARYCISNCEQCMHNYLVCLVHRKEQLNRIRRWVDASEIKDLYTLDVLGMLN